MGPQWLDTERYDIAATLPPGAGKDDFRLMLQHLLAERFCLSQHRATKDLPIYAMVLGDRGLRLRASRPEPAAEAAQEPVVTTVTQGKDGFPVVPRGYRGHMIGMKVPGRVMLRARGESRGEFATVLSSLLDRPVLDFTGLSGTYDFGIAWATDDAPASDPAPDGFAALAALGLKLERRTAPTELLVVDRVERTPTVN